jgi:hypothetical protein
MEPAEYKTNAVSFQVFGKYIICSSTGPHKKSVAPSMDDGTTPLKELCNKS